MEAKPPLVHQAHATAFDPTSAQQEGREEENNDDSVLNISDADRAQWYAEDAQHLRDAVTRKNAEIESLTSQLSDKDKRIAEQSEEITELKWKLNDAVNINRKLEEQLQGERAAAAKAWGEAVDATICATDGVVDTKRIREAKSIYINNNYPSKEK